MPSFFSIKQNQKKLLTEQEAVVQRVKLVVVASWVVEQLGVDEGKEETGQTLGPQAEQDTAFLMG